MLEILNKFKRLEITKSKLQEFFQRDLADIHDEEPVYINNMDAVLILEKYQRGEIEVNDILDWVNVVWFTDLYEYDYKYHYSLGSVLNELEELDEEGRNLTKEKVKHFIWSLKNNT